MFSCPFKLLKYINQFSIASNLKYNNVRNGFCSNSIKFSESTVVEENTLKLLEKLSLVNFDSDHYSVLKDAIQFADKISHVNTDNIEPLITVLENRNLKLRNDEVTEGNCRSAILMNAAVIEEDYFVAPPGNIPLHFSDSTEQK